MGKTSKTILYFTLGNYFAKNQLASLEAILEKIHELSEKNPKDPAQTRSVAALKSSTVGLVTPHAHWGLVPPMRRHRRETTTSCRPHHTTSLVNRERCTGDAKLDGSRMESSAGWLTVNCR